MRVLSALPSPASLLLRPPLLLLRRHSHHVGLQHRRLLRGRHRPPLLQLPILYGQLPVLLLYSVQLLLLLHEGSLLGRRKRRGLLLLLKQLLRRSEGIRHLLQRSEGRHTPSHHRRICSGSRVIGWCRPHRLVSAGHRPQPPPHRT